MVQHIQPTEQTITADFGWPLMCPMFGTIITIPIDRRRFRRQSLAHSLYGVSENEQRMNAHGLEVAHWCSMVQMVLIGPKFVRLNWLAVVPLTINGVLVAVLPICITIASMKSTTTAYRGLTRGLQD